MMKSLAIVALTCPLLIFSLALQHRDQDEDFQTVITVDWLPLPSASGGVEASEPVSMEKYASTKTDYAEPDEAATTTTTTVTKETQYHDHPGTNLDEETTTKEAVTSSTYVTIPSSSVAPYGPCHPAPNSSPSVTTITRSSSIFTTITKTVKVVISTETIGDDSDVDEATESSTNGGETRTAYENPKPWSTGDGWGDN